MFKLVQILTILLLINLLFGLNRALAEELYYPIGTNPISTTAPFAGETIYPTGEPFTEKHGIKFWLYNDGSGALDLNLRLLQKEKLYMSPPVVSPDFNHMVYTEVFYFADVNEVVSKCFYIPIVLPEPTVKKPDITFKDYVNSYKVRYDQQIRYETMSVTSRIMRHGIFKTLTIVDWAYDSNRVLIKEHIGRMGRGIVGTVVWIYEVQDDRLYRVDTVRKAIIAYWLKTKHLNLNKHVWDIDVVGWVENSNTHFVVNAYLYPKKHEKLFLGCWSADINGSMSQLLSLEDEHWKVGQYGLVPEEQFDYTRKN